MLRSRRTATGPRGRRGLRALVGLVVLAVLTCLGTAAGATPVVPTPTVATPTPSVAPTDLTPTPVISPTLVEEPSTAPSQATPEASPVKRIDAADPDADYTLELQARCASPTRAAVITVAVTPTTDTARPFTWRLRGDAELDSPGVLSFAAPGEFKVAPVAAGSYTLDLVPVDTAQPTISVNVRVLACVTVPRLVCGGAIFANPAGNPAVTITYAENVGGDSLPARTQTVDPGASAKIVQGASFVWRAGPAAPLAGQPSTVSSSAGGPQRVYGLDCSLSSYAIGPCGRPNQPVTFPLYVATDRYPFRYAVTDASGRVVASRSGTDGDRTFPITVPGPGHYQLRLTLTGSLDPPSVSDFYVTQCLTATVLCQAVHIFNPAANPLESVAVRYPGEENPRDVESGQTVIVPWDRGDVPFSFWPTYYFSISGTYASAADDEFPFYLTQTKAVYLDVPQNCPYGSTPSPRPSAPGGVGGRATSAATSASLAATGAPAGLGLLAVLAVLALAGGVALTRRSGRRQ